MTQLKQTVTHPLTNRKTDSGKGREGSANWHATMTPTQTRR